MKIHHLQGYMQSIYLVEYEEKLLLLDGCCRCDLGILRNHIENTLARNFNDLKMIVVTHMHPDHAGAAHLLRKLTGCKIASANKQRDWYQGIDGMMMHWSDIFLALFVGSRLGRSWRNLWYPRKLLPDYQLNDKDTLPGFDDWQVLETPGHTDRDLSVYHAQSRQVYIGDVVLKVKGVFIHPFPIFHPNQYRQSVQKIRNLGVSKVMLAHGGEVDVCDDDFQTVINNAPDKPKTHFRMVKRLAGKYIPWR